MKRKIGQIAETRTGIFAKPRPDGDVVYLQAKHFDEYGIPRPSTQPELAFNSINPKHLLNPSDVLFAAKGTKNFATVFGSFGLPAVASTTFFVLRTRTKEVLPEFLAWTLNAPDAQQYFRLNANSSTVISVSKAALEELVVTIPSIERQQLILSVSTLERRAMEIERDLAELRRQRTQQIIRNALKN